MSDTGGPEDPEVAKLREQLAEVEAATKRTELRQRVVELEQELKYATTKFDELKNSGDDS
jgi:hypothetical protein